jgi:hypothetical protein
MRSTSPCLAVLSSVLLTACASTLPPDKATHIFDRRCLPASTELRQMPLSHAEVPALPGASAGAEPAGKVYSRIAVHIAQVMDLLPLLNRLAALETERASAGDIERTRRKLTTRLQLANLEVSGIVAEIECEVQRADEVQDRLKQAEQTRTTTQTILGVIFGGLANILSGGISMATQAGDAAHIASVAGGALEVLFGTSANFTKVRQEFSHPHNHLQAFWEGGGKEREFFPSSVWRFLTEPNIRDAEGHSLRDVLMETWDAQGRLGSPGSRKEQQRKELLLGEGGLYDSEDLHVREAMLHQMESSIQLMHKDLETLLREILLRQALEEEQAEVPGRPEQSLSRANTSYPPPHEIVAISSIG